MMKKINKTFAMIVCIASMKTAIADGVKRVPVLDIYTQECASCHLAYPPALLPRTSWQKITGSLNKHFGVDASLDASSQQKISQWLMNNAATGKRNSQEPPNDRITQSEWFLRKHNRHEVAAEIWKRPAVGSPSNCNACHTKATQGDFEEDNIRIPK